MRALLRTLLFVQTLRESRRGRIATQEKLPRYTGETRASGAQFVPPNFSLPTYHIDTLGTIQLVPR